MAEINAEKIIEIAFYFICLPKQRDGRPEHKYRFNSERGPHSNTPTEINERNSSNGRIYTTITCYQRAIKEATREPRVPPRTLDLLLTSINRSFCSDPILPICIRMLL